MLRPGVIWSWYGEELPDAAFALINAWLDAAPTVDLVLLIRTTRTPIIGEVLAMGAALAHLDLVGKLQKVSFAVAENEWLVNGDVARMLPGLVEIILGPR